LANKFTNIIDGIKNNPTLTVKEQLGYCGGIFGNAMGQDSVCTYGDQFDRDYMGISAENQLVKSNVSTIIGFFIPPIAGALYDVQRKPGKTSFVRRAIGVTPLPFAIASMMLFIVPTHSAIGNLIWTYVFGLIFSIADTFFDTAMGTLGLRMVPNPKDRKNFFTLTSLASTLGSMLPGWLIPIVIGKIDDFQKQQWAYFWIALVFCILGLASMYCTYFLVKDKPVNAIAAGKETEEKIHWNKNTILAILHNRPFIVTQLSLSCDSVRQVTYNTLPYLYRNTFGDYGMKAIIDVISGALSYVGLFAVPVVGNKISARNMLAGGYGYTAFFYLLMSLFNIKFSVGKVRKYKYVIGVLIGLAGMPNGAQGAARKIIVADSTDYMEWYSAKHYGAPIRSDGVLTAVQNLFSKFNSLLRANLYNGLMGAIGYQSKDPVTGVTPEQTPETLHGIYKIITLCGLAGNIASAICFLFDNYTGKRKEAINAELAQLREGRVEEI